LDIDTIPTLCYGAMARHRLWLLLECIPTPSSIQFVSIQSISFPDKRLSISCTEFGLLYQQLKTILPFK
jgi:hypothetical protein